MIIDATYAPLGRLASTVAKLAREGEEVVIINAGNAIFKKDKNFVIRKLVESKHKGTPTKGPFTSFSSVEIVKRSIRGMLERKRKTGRLAKERIKIYKGVPDGIDVSKAVRLFETRNNKYPTVEEISKSLGYE
ncbi:MAG: uL13 family ribosomal protein [Conexivisphaerales archaeon]